MFSSVEIHFFTWDRIMVRAAGLEPARTCEDAAVLKTAVSAFPPRPQARKGGVGIQLPGLLRGGPLIYNIETAPFIGQFHNAPIQGTPKHPETVMFWNT